MQYVRTESDWHAAVNQGATDAILDVPGNEFHDWTVGGILSCGISNPFAAEYSLIGEMDTFCDEADFVSWEDLKEIEAEQQLNFDIEEYE